MRMLYDMIRPGVLRAQNLGEEECGYRVKRENWGPFCIF